MKNTLCKECFSYHFRND